MKRIAYLLVILAAGFSFPALAREPVIDRSVEDFALPAYDAFRQATGALQQNMDALCSEPSDAALGAARAGFLKVVDTWSAAEIVRFGPVTEENRLERILFWPDRKGIGLKQVQAALAKKDPAAADPAQIAAKSVAMQGLGALEFVLHGTGAEGLAGRGQAYRCAYGKSIAQNLAGVAVALFEDWRAPNGIRETWANPGPDNPLYRTDQEALTELLNIFVHGLELVRDVRVNGFLGETAKADKPRQAIFWRSGATVAALRTNLRGMRSLFDAANLSERLSPSAKWIAQSIGFEFANADRALSGLDGPIANLLTDPAARKKLAYFKLVTSSLSELFGVRLSSNLGLTAGFSSLDGD
jgi:predicted lipoprotein